MTALSIYCVAYVTLLCGVVLQRYSRSVGTFVAWSALCVILLNAATTMSC